MMRSRLLLLGKNIPKLLQPRRMPNIPKIRHYAAKSDFCDAHMNELPIPCGDFETYNEDHQAFYNKVLLFGALWWVLSLVLMIYTGSIYLNFYPPKNPSPPSDMVSNEDKTC